MSVFDKIEPHFAGELVINEGETIDITDPCYDKNVWCRINDVKVKSGTYLCYSYIDEKEILGWGKRPWANEIILPEYKDKGVWYHLGNIGVDAGLAGYFVNKPNFTDKEWLELCKYMEYDDSGNNENFAKGLWETFLVNDPLLNYKGFYTESGAGDGGYEVYAMKDGDEIVGLRIDFAGEIDEDM